MKGHILAAQRITMDPEVSSASLSREIMKGKYKTHKGTALQVTNAAGAEGCLIRDGIDHKWYFRVYEAEDKSKFVDYALRHLDLQVHISSDEMAAFYQDEDGNAWLDYSPEVLGLEPHGSDDE